jgi:DNA-binding GntR family transcriptional regulator
VRAVEKAYEAIRAGIADGRFAPNTRITEQEVAAAAGVSRTPAREALRRLQAEGLLTFTPNQGAVVTSWSADDIDEIFELRVVLESQGAYRAASRATSKQMSRLKELALAYEIEVHTAAPGYLERIATLNSDFHRELYNAAGSPRLNRALAALLETALVHRTFWSYSPEDLRRSAAHHTELAQAVEAHDPEWAGSVMRAHILAAKRTLTR